MWWRLSLVVGVDLSWSAVAVIGRQLGVSRLELEGEAAIAQDMPEHARCARACMRALSCSSSSSASPMVPSPLPTPTPTLPAFPLIPIPISPPPPQILTTSAPFASSEAALMHAAAAQLRASPFFQGLDDGGCYSVTVIDEKRLVHAASPPLEALFKSSGEMVEELMRLKTLHCFLNAA